LQEPHRIWHFEKWLKLVEAEFVEEECVESLKISVRKLHEEYPIRVDPTESLEKLIKEWQD